MKKKAKEFTYQIIRVQVELWDKNGDGPKIFGAKQFNLMSPYSTIPQGVYHETMFLCGAAVGQLEDGLFAENQRLKSLSHKPKKVKGRKKN